MSNPNFDSTKFEKKWQEKWEKEKLYDIKNPIHKDKPKYYCLDMFPYPSGSGLHVGHFLGYVLSDVISRYKMLNGCNVLHPMGWDAFGLPAENYAIKMGIAPEISTKANIENIKEQLKKVGCMYDWSREFSTTDPDYYKWTQWIFIQMFKYGLAYQKEQPVNWCDDCKVVLANEEVNGGKCERCGNDNIKKVMKKQWMLKITDYADKLLSGLEKLNWPQKVIEMQKNWIGKSKGAKVRFDVVKDNRILENVQIEVFTTRVDTLFGATFMAISPEHKFAFELTTESQRDQVKKYMDETGKISNIDRQRQDRPKTGTFTGSYAINPVNKAKLPIYIADYILIDYGAGAIMAVPAHDERDFEFAKTHGIEIIEVIYSETANRNLDKTLSRAYTGDGIIINSKFINGLSIKEAQKEMVKFLEKENRGEFVTTYRLRDWIFARQRYWGEPIPIIHCPKCGAVPVLESELPLILPKLDEFKPSGVLKSPLSLATDWVKTKCPVCGEDAERETDTMPQWAGSSWYFLRYPDNNCDDALISQETMKKWLPVDMYIGGVEHAVLHLLYSRFWTKFLHSIGILDFDEPFEHLFNQGMICKYAYRCPAENKWFTSVEIDELISKNKNQNSENLKCPHCNAILEKSLEKMSKSKGNVTSPDDLISEYGTDSMRLYELFAGDASLDSVWSDNGIKGSYSFLQKTWNFVLNSEFTENPSDGAILLIHTLIKKVTERIELFKFNTAISAFMEFINDALKLKSPAFSKNMLKDYLILLSPFAPHTCEELWNIKFGETKSIFLVKWPKYDEKIVDNAKITIAVQVNGKTRDLFETQKDTEKSELQALALSQEKIKEFIGDNSIKKTIVVPNRLVNFVV